MTAHLEYDGKQLPIRVGYYALKHTSQEYKESTNQEMDMAALLSGDITVLEPLLYYSVKFGHILEKTEMTLKREEVEIILDLYFEDFIEMINNAFPKLMGMATAQQISQAMTHPQNNEQDG